MDDKTPYNSYISQYNKNVGRVKLHGDTDLFRRTGSDTEGQAGVFHFNDSHL